MAEVRMICGVFRGRLVGELPSSYLRALLSVPVADISQALFDAAAEELRGRDLRKEHWDEPWGDPLVEAMASPEAVPPVTVRMSGPVCQLTGG